ncbi:MAG: amidohydrolase family protein [Ardenticatenaceae bacterium]|nr:amidohydrolase family protein [Ardenticatenaceae bacterium]MCB8992052.1 amidohydrolase family protein [Ardenticatenaceae bacterium]MCB9004689.1 amidohydrolase family protein [Ardenticatenaceae bacterium]
MHEKVNLLLVGGAVVTMNDAYDVLPNGAVAIRGDSIVAVGDVEEVTAVYEAAQTLDCTGQVIMPGLVNAHTHVPMSLLRGLNDDLRLDVWLGYLMPLEREFVTPEFVKLGTRLAAAEMIRSGITSFADMYYFEEAIAEETAVIGMRALLGQTILVFPAPDAPTYEDALILCRRFIERWNGHELIQPAVSPHAWYTATPELLRACADLARAYDVPIHTHIGETRLELENCQEQNHMRTVTWNAKQSILDTKLLAAHCVHIDRDEMFQLKEAGAGVAHCPTSNLKLASGIAPVSQMLEMGLNVGVGTDGPASNNDLDMFEETRLAALLAKTASNDPTMLPARQAVEMATIGGARALHMADVTGSLEVGKRADVIVVAMDGVHNQPHFHNHEDAIYSRLIYAAKAPDVVHVVCNGRFLLHDRQLTTIDEAETKEQAAAVAARIDAFVHERESSPYNKLVFLAGVERQESFEVQVKVPLDGRDRILSILESGQIEINRQSHYRQYDTYFLFAKHDPDAARLRYREDEFINEHGEPYQVRSRLTLIGEEERAQFPNAVMLSRSRFLASADRTLRFYREYFAPDTEVTLVKDRLRWHILYEGTDFAINLDQVVTPTMPGYYLEIKSRTWSRNDAERKARLIAEILELFGVNPEMAEPKDYPELALIAG